MGPAGQTAYRRRSKVRNDMAKNASSNGANSGLEVPNVVESTPVPVEPVECHPEFPGNRIRQNICERETRDGLIAKLIPSEGCPKTAETAVRVAAS